jgi:hypothetical protein
MDSLVSDLAHFEQAAAGADVALLDLVGAVHNRRACHRREPTTRLQTSRHVGITHLNDINCAECESQ